MIRRAFQGPSRREAADHREPPPAAIGERTLFRIEDPLGAQRRGDVERAADLEPGESTPGNADDLERMAIERHGFSDDRWIAAVLPLPEGVSKYGGWRTATGSIILRRQQTSEVWRDGEHVEEVAAHPQTLDKARLAACGQIHRVRAPGKHSRERLLAPAEFLPQGVRK